MAVGGNSKDLNNLKNTLFHSNKNKVIKFKKSSLGWHLFDVSLVASFQDSLSV